MSTSLLHPTSLVQTLDAVNEAMFLSQGISKAQSRQVAAWLVGRVSSPEHPVRGSYRGMPAPTEADFKSGGKVFTGESVTSRAGMACRFGFEGLRAICLLDGSQAGQKKVRDASAWLAEAEELYVRIGRPAGTYCCASCSTAMWRLAAAGGVNKGEAWLSKGLKSLSQQRDRKGKWKKFPFYYALLALSEIDLPAARQELAYAAGVCEGLIKRGGGDKYALRRRKLLERVLAQV